MFRGFVEELADQSVRIDYYTSDPAPVAGDVVVHLLPGSAVGSLLLKALRWLSFTLRTGLSVARTPRPSGLLIVTNPPVAPLAGLLLKRLQGRPYVLLFYDLYPKVLVAATGLREGSWICRAIHAANRAAVRGADGVVTISAGMAEELGRYLPDEEARGRIVVVPTWVDTGWIRPMGKRENPFAKRHGQTEKLTVLYAGNLGTVHDLSLVPDLAEAFREDDGLHFLIVGEGTRRPALEAAVAAKGLQNVTFLPPQPEVDLPLVLATGDVALVALAEGAEGASMPSKTYYAMAAGSALLGLSRPGSDLADVIERFQCGRNVNPRDFAGAIAALREFRARPDLLSAWRLNARRAAEAHFDRALCAPRLAAAVLECLG